MYYHYYHRSKTHSSSVTHDGQVVKESGKYGAGYTSIANGPSVQVNHYDISQWYQTY
ncbi:lactococcin 972 family bacteriocin [Inconstantimicrobium mannanitabidum]|uniref:lactococcin 972 family bacteriocin n=1 Tax=Inconstantimicrobium mannanitabidum TaxID=1604901 RepID=UPI0035E43967